MQMRSNHTDSIEPLESRIAPASLLTVTYDVVSGALTLADDVANNAVGVDADNGFAIFKTGANTYRIVDSGGTDIGAPGVTFRDIGKVTSLSITGDEGADNSFLTGLNALKSLTYDGGAGTDQLIAADLLVKGAASINLGADGGSASFDGALTSIGGDLTVIYGAAGGMVGFGAISTVLKGAVILTGGLGDDVFTFSGAGDTATVGKGIKLTGSDGSDSIFINSRLSAVVGKAALTGNAIEFEGGTGNNLLSINSAGAVSLKGNVIFNGGIDADEVALQSSVLTVDGELKINGGGDVDIATIGGSKVTLKKAVTIDMADGGSTVSIGANLVALGSTLSVKGTTGADDMSITVSKFTAGKAVSFDGGAGNDSFTLDASSVLIKGALTITGGGDADTASIRADGLISGDVTIDLGTSSDGNQDMSLMGRSGLAGNLKLGGKLTITSLADDGMIGWTDLLTVTDVTVSKVALITLGSADSTAVMDNFNTKDLFTLNTGEGDDTVNIEQNNFFGPSIMSKAVTISLGDGDDTILIGKSSLAGTSDFVKFLAALQVDGGNHNVGDTRNDFGLNSINVFVPPATSNPSNFETVI